MFHVEHLQYVEFTTPVVLTGKRHPPLYGAQMHTREKEGGGIIITIPRFKKNCTHPRCNPA